MKYYRNITPDRLEPVKEAERLRGIFAKYDGPDYDLPNIYVSPKWDEIWKIENRLVIITDQRIERTPEILEAIEEEVAVLFHGKNILFDSEHWNSVNDEILIYRGFTDKELQDYLNRDE